MKNLGVLLPIGYHSLPEEHHYWSTQPDLEVPAHHEIKRYLHFADSQGLTK